MKVLPTYAGFGYWFTIGIKHLCRIAPLKTMYAHNR